MDLGLAGRKALVCGGSAGLGGASAKFLSAAGADLYISARGSERLEAAAESIREETGGKVTTIIADHGTAEGREALFAGCPDPEVLVITRTSPPWTPDYREVTDEQWADSFDAGFHGPVELMKQYLDGMAERKFGRVVHIATIAAKFPLEQRVLSGPARSALANFVHGISKRYARDNVVINTLLPGFFHTDGQGGLIGKWAAANNRTLEEEVAATVESWNLPAGRFGSADEAAHLCAMLCAENAGFITGQSIVVDGGLCQSLM